MSPDDVKYHREHQWVRLEGKRAVVGITDYAQEELGDIVYIELPETGVDLTAEEDITEIESTKTTAPLIAPVSGRIVEVNDALKDAPELMNEDPYGKGWIVTIEMSDPAEADDLMDSKEYEEFLKEQA
ncbi:MAG TPA: glycine cleavage system protein GcvH [Nitrospiria bacterium]|nr:glycine cleavage system protein GcvH [Nitrospiria bacterium]